MADLHDNTELIRAIGEGYRNFIPVETVAHTTFWDVAHLFWDWWSSYCLAFFLLFYDQLDTIVSWGGFVLLIVRLVADGPRAYKTLKDYLRGKQGS